ncbi:MAG: hypothetical protein IJS15_08960, partial [Victivallales bacterium]|nr:hypothetical protein [Victivallales bacterium]
MRKSLYHLTSCLLLSSAFSVLLYTPGVELYYSNAEQFNVGPVFLLYVFAAMALATTIVMAALLGGLHSRYPEGAQAVGLACCANVLLQYNIWSKVFDDYGVEIGLTWYHILLSIIHAALLILPFMLALRFRRILAKYAARISIVVLLTQAAVVVNSAIHYKAPNYDFREFAFSEADKFSFGQQENVIIMVVDCMGEGIAKEVLGKYPELRESFADFTC